jgi:hypothetical protein
VDKVRPKHVFAMIAGHLDSGRWQVPAFMQNQPELDILESYFDDEGFLAYKPLIRHTLCLETLFAQAYRRMWKDCLMEIRSFPTRQSLDDLVDFLRRNYETSDRDAVWKLAESKRNELGRLIHLVDDGLSASNKLIRIYKERGFDTLRIQALGDRISSIDDGIRKMGLMHPELNPLCDMFDRRKENFEGADLLDLARRTRQCYGKFKMEVEFLQAILDHLLENLAGKMIRPHQAEVSSSRMAVPGR